MVFSRGSSSPLDGFDFGLGSRTETPSLPTIPAEAERSFSGAALIATLLEGEADNRRMTESLASGSARHLAQAIDQLSPSERQALRERWGRSLDELISLSQERDARIFHQGLLQVGHRLEESDRVELAGVVYASLAADAPPLPNPLPRGERGPILPSPLAGEGGRRPGEGAALAGIANQAQRHLNAINGVGDWRERVGFQARHMSTAVTEISPLFAMGVAGPAFRLTRLLTLGRIGASPALGLLMRPALASAAANLVGFGAEVLAFSAAGRAADAVLGHEAHAPILQELASGTIFLGCLKVAGAFGQGAVRVMTPRAVAGRALELNASGALAQFLVPHTATLGGILVSHRVEEAFGLREPTPGATTFTDAIALMFQLNAAGRLTHAAFGPGYTRFERDLEHHTQLFSSSALAERLETEGRGLADLMTPDLVTPEGIRISARLSERESVEGEPIQGPPPQASEPVFESHEVFNPAEAMASSTRRAGRGGEPPVPPPPGSGGGSTPPTDPEIAAVRLRGRRYRVRLALDDFRHADRVVDPSYAAEALAILRSEPELAREELIGRDFEFLSPARWDQLYQEAFRIPGFEARTRPELRRVLIANRGEIAIRLARTLVAERITPYFVASSSDAKAGWARELRNMGASMVRIGGETPQESYLNVPKILSAARRMGVDAIHPGYGYLSENVAFRQAVEAEGRVFLGPSVETMRLAGDKDAFKRSAREARVPVVPGTDRGYAELPALLEEMNGLGLIAAGELRAPVRLKAVGGGGGRGQATVRSLAELERVFPRLSAEARNAFNDPRIMAELAIGRFQHLEFQIMGDRFGNVIHLGERECTAQERNQKLLEFHPAEIFERFSGLRDRMAEAAVRAARAVNYSGHGTVEFLLNPDSGEFFAMEVNARIQVEHRVTEAVTGIDLVAEQLRVSRGLPLSLSQSQVRARGAAVEIRIKAVDITQRDREGNPVALPEAGATVRHFTFPAESGVHMEQSVWPGDRISPYADPMIAKLIVTGGNRAEALARAIHVLERTRIEGLGPDGKRELRTDLDRQLRLLRTRAVREASYDNSFVDEWMRSGEEDQSRFPHTLSLKLREGLNTPVYLQVVSGRAFTAPEVHALEGELTSLFRVGGGSLGGVLAEYLRTQSPLLGRARSARRGTTTAVQAQVGADGVLRQVLLYNGTRLERLLLGRSTETETGGWENAVEEIRFPRTGASTVARHITRDAEGEFHLNGSSLPTESPGRVLRFFGDRPHELRLKMRQTDSSTAVTLRDRDWNVLLRSSSLEVTEDLGSRVLGLIESLRTDIGAPRRQEVQADLADTLRGLATLAPEHAHRRAAVEFLGSTTQSVVMELSEVADRSRDPRVHALTDEIIARRELQRHEVQSYLPLDPQTSAVRFIETTASGERVPRLMIRSLLPEREASPHLLLLDYRETLERAQRYLRDQMNEGEAARDNVIQVWIRRRRAVQPSLNPEFLMQTVRTALGEGSEDMRSEDLVGRDLRLKRVTYGIFGGGEYPYYYTFRRSYSEDGRSGPFEEDLRYRGIHPQVANSLLEIPRLDLFDVERDPISDRFQHLYYARNRDARDYRLFGMGVVPHAEVIAHSRSSLEIPALEQALGRLAGAMESSLRSRPERNRPLWNRLFLNIQPTLAVTEVDFLRYVEQLLNGRWQRQEVDGRPRRVLTGGSLEQMAGLNLEKVVLRARLRDSRVPRGYRDVLLRLSNPTGFRFEGQIHSILRTPVRSEEGAVRTREVLVEPRAFQRWLKERDGEDFALAPGEWQPADIPIRPATPEEIREVEARSRGAVWAYRIPSLLSDVAEGFLAYHGLGNSRPAERRSGPNAFDPRFLELELDSRSTRVHARTGVLDPNYGELIPAFENRDPRAPGRNRAGLVIGEHVVDLGLTDEVGVPLHVRRLVIMGDVTHRPSRGSLSEEECARINAAIRYAQRLRIPIDWFVASSGAQITREKGVENLEATASTFREIVLSAMENSRNPGETPVPINFIVPDYSIGAMSYYIAVGAIAQQTRGTVIMVSPPSDIPSQAAGSMGLTGDVAMTATARPNLSFIRLRQEAERMYPRGNRSIAGYETIHGPNGEAMAVAPDLRSAIERLMDYHYFTYTPNGLLAGLRPSREPDAPDRDITQDVSVLGRTVGQEIALLRTGRGHDFMSVLNALRDRGSPEPVVLWREDFRIRDMPESLRRELPARLPKALVAFCQIGGNPVQVVYLAQAISPADAERMARAIHLGNERVPLLFMGSWPGFWSDPNSMAARQLTHGGALGAAMVTRRGPTLIVNMQYSVGGAKVVVAKSLRRPAEQDQHRVLALAGAREQVIGGVSVENVIGIYAKENLAAARAEPEVRAAEVALHAARGDEARRSEAQRVYDETLERHLWRIIGERARVFDERHSVTRAQLVGSVDRVIEPSELRPAIIEELATATAAYLEWVRREAARERELLTDQVVHAENEDLLLDLIQGMVRLGGTEIAQDRALFLARGLLEFAHSSSEPPGTPPESASSVEGAPAAEGTGVRGEGTPESARPVPEREGEPP